MQEAAPSPKGGVADSSISRPPSVKTSTFAAKIEGSQTDFALLQYSNRVFLTVSQCQRIGNLYLVHRDSPRQGGHVIQSTGPAIYNVRCVLGGEDQELCVAVRALAEKLSLSKPLLVSLTLPSPSPQALNTISEIIKRHL